MVLKSLTNEPTWMTNRTKTFLDNILVKITNKNKITLEHVVIN